MDQIFYSNAFLNVFYVRVFTKKYFCFGKRRFCLAWHFQWNHFDEEVLKSISTTLIRIYRRVWTDNYFSCCFYGEVLRFTLSHIIKIPKSLRVYFMFVMETRANTTAEVEQFNRWKMFLHRRNIHISSIRFTYQWIYKWIKGVTEHAMCSPFWYLYVLTRLDNWTSKIFSTLFNVKKNHHCGVDALHSLFLYTDFVVLSPTWQ